MNEEFDFWGVKGGGVTDIKNLKKKNPHRMVVPTHTENFITLAQLESI